MGFLFSAIVFFILFLLPGLMVTRIFFTHDDLDLFQRLAIGFSFILGVFLVVFLATTALALNWQVVQWTWSLITIVLIAAGVARWRSNPSGKQRVSKTEPHKLDKTIFILVAVLAVAAALTLLTPRDEDDWSYYQIVRGFVDAPRFQPISPTSLRAGLSVWWFFHAFLIRTFNFDIVQLGRDYLPLLLVPLAFTAFYTFARTLLQDRNKAIVASVLQLGFFVVDLFYNDPNVQLTGGWVLGRIDQDHTAAEFIFLPVYLTLVYQYVESGALRWLLASFVALVTLSAVHPQGFVQASILTLAFLVAHLSLSWRRGTLKRIAILLIPFTAVFVLLLPFILFWSDFARTAGFDLSYLAAGQSNFPFTFRWITFLTPRDFILRSDLLGQPFILSALLLTPLLIPLLRSNSNVRFLFGSMLVLFVILFTPPPFVLLSRWLGWPIYRIWYLFPSVLVIVYLSPQVSRWITTGIAQMRHQAWNRQTFAALLCLAGIALIASRFPDFIRGAPAELGIQQRLPAGSPELYAALRQAAPLGGVVLAPTAISDPIPSYRTSLSPVIFRYNTSQERIDDAGTFYASRLLTLNDLDILSKYNVEFLVVPSNRESISQFDLSPAYFTPLYRNQNWALFHVNQPLGESTLVRANTLFIQSDLQGAINTYNRALSDNSSNSLAHLGLGMALQVLDKPRLAAHELEEAVRIAPSNVQAHYYLASIYRKMGMNEQAQIHAAAAGALKGQEQ
jgi:Family of unknown function (DUF6077)